MQRKHIIPNEKRNIGTVTPEERDNIRILHERRNALMELFKTLPDLEKDEADFLYEKIVNDLGQVTTKYHDWWTQMSLRYKWENSNGMQWEIEFETCNIFIKNGTKG
jgi:CXXX repeat modification system protein